MFWSKLRRRRGPKLKVDTSTDTSLCTSSSESSIFFSHKAVTCTEVSSYLLSHNYHPTASIIACVEQFLSRASARLMLYKNKLRATKCQFSVCFNNNAKCKLFSRASLDHGIYLKTDFYFYSWNKRTTVRQRLERTEV